MNFAKSLTAEIKTRHDLFIGKCSIDLSAMSEYEILDLKKREEAAQEEALRLEPDNFRVANNLAVLLAAQKTGLDDALAMIRRALEREPNRATYLDTLGLVHQARGDKAASSAAPPSGCDCRASRGRWARGEATARRSTRRTCC